MNLSSPLHECYLQFDLTTISYPSDGLSLLTTVTTAEVSFTATPTYTLIHLLILLLISWEVGLGVCIRKQLYGVSLCKSTL